MRNRVAVYDLSGEDPHEKFFLDSTDQFFGFDHYVDVGIAMAYCTDDLLEVQKDGHIYNMFDTNRTKSSVLWRC